jgi:hypothetical protein
VNHVLRRSLLVVAVLATGLATLAAAADAGTQLRFSGGATRLVMNPAVLPALAGAGVSITPVAPATAGASEWNGQPTIAARFPIRGGHADATTLVGIINHRGGLTFSKGSSSLTVGRFRISIHRRAYLSGEVGFNPAMRVPLLRLDLSQAHVSASGSWVTVSHVRAYLTRTAAQALNATLGTTVFAPGLKLGVARVHARLGA